MRKKEEMSEQEEEKKGEGDQRPGLKKRKSTKWERKSQNKYRGEKEKYVDNPLFLI